MGAGIAMILFVLSFWCVQETNQTVIKKKALKQEQKMVLKKKELSILIVSFYLS